MIKFTEEQHKNLKIHMLDMLHSAGKIQSIVADDDDCLKIIEKIFRVSKEFSIEMIRKGYGHN